MGLRQWGNEQSKGIQVALVLGILIGVVVLTVVGAAVVGAFVLGVGESVPTAPQASFSVSASAGGDTVRIIHSGGESIEASSLAVEVPDRTVPWAPADGTVDAKDELAAENVESGTEITVVWTGEDAAEMVLLTYVV
jgi:FlaG/FlaF family flagellin (archaellin)